MKKRKKVLRCFMIGNGFCPKWINPDRTHLRTWVYVVGHENVWWDTRFHPMCFELFDYEGEIPQKPYYGEYGYTGVQVIPGWDYEHVAAGAQRRTDERNWALSVVGRKEAGYSLKSLIDDARELTQK